MCVMRYSEEVAKIVIESLCPGYEMRHADAEHESVPDFELFVGNSLRGVVEVTESVNDQSFKCLNGTKLRESPIPARKCRSNWVIAVTTEADLKDVRRGIDKVLAVLEDNGCREYYGAAPASIDITARRSIEDGMLTLGVFMAHSTDPADGKTEIHIMSPGRSGSLSPTVLNDAILVEANKRDNLQKASSGKDAERHLFVLLTWQKNIAPWRLVVRHSPPPGTLSVPHEFTHIWATGIADSGDAVVWRMENGKSWEVLGQVAVANLPAPPR
jgi:hypothetical protein